MRAIWSQAARPRLSCNQAPRDPSSSILSRRTTTARLRRRLKFSDAFTILLAPVLATAFVADTSWKEKRRRDWDGRIAEIQQELEIVHAREAASWSRLQVQSVRIGARHQRRSYSTASSAVAEPSYLGDESEQSSESSPESTDDLKCEAETWYPVDPSSGPTEEDLAALRKFERLIIVKLALRMILHIHVGPSPRYDTRAEEYQIKSGAPPENMNAISRRLQKVSKILSTSGSNIYTFDSFRDTAMTPAKQLLHDDIKALALGLGEHRLSISEFAERFAYVILQSSETPSRDTYTMLIRTFGHTDFHEMSMLSIHALLATRLPLDDFDVFSIILEAGKGFNVRYFNELLEGLTLDARRLNIKDRWEWWRISGTRVPVPVSQNPRILQALVYLSTRCHQIERAEAWAEILKEKDYGGVWKVNIFKIFLNYYAAHLDWEKGRKWIVTSIPYLTSIAHEGDDPLNSIARLIFRILDLCTVCGQREDYNRILQAAVASGINRPTRNPAKPPRFSERSLLIKQEWNNLYTFEGQNKWLTDVEKARNFQDILQSAYAANPTTNQDIGAIHASEQLDENTLLQLREQKAAIDQLQRELAESRKLLEAYMSIKKPNDIVGQKGHDQRPDLGELRQETARLNELLLQSQNVTAPPINSLSFDKAPSVPGPNTQKHKTPSSGGSEQLQQKVLAKTLTKELEEAKLYMPSGIKDQSVAIDKLLLKVPEIKLQIHKQSEMQDAAVSDAQPLPEEPSTKTNVDNTAPPETTTSNTEFQMEPSAVDRSGERISNVDLEAAHSSEVQNHSFPDAEPKGEESLSNLIVDIEGDKSPVNETKTFDADVQSHQISQVNTEIIDSHYDNDLNMTSLDLDTRLTTKLAAPLPVRDFVTDKGSRIITRPDLSFESDPDDPFAGAFIHTHQGPLVRLHGRSNPVRKVQFSRFRKVKPAESKVPAIKPNLAARTFAAINKARGEPRGNFQLVRSIEVGEA